MKTKNKIISSMCALTMLAPVTILAADNEFGSNTSYYEDDGWLDVTEWFDANDYNPTDEKLGRWDDEAYQADKDTGTDVDSDW